MASLIAPTAEDSKIEGLETRLAEAHKRNRVNDKLAAEVERLKAKLNAARAKPQTDDGQLVENDVYNPGPIQSTGISVTADTPLAIGDTLQVQWQGTSWWAAEVNSLEADGWVGIRYVGWSDSHNEIVPREHLQLDPDAEEIARATKRPR